MGTIVFCASEAAPYAKVGGLGDVVGSLPKALAGLGLKPVIVLPRYGFINTDEFHLKKLSLHFDVSMLNRTYRIEVWQAQLPGTEPDHPVTVYFLENADYFASRQTVYPMGQPQQEVEGFLLLSKALFPLLRKLEIRPQILHLHDWHTAPAAVDFLEERARDAFFADTRSILTLHNIAYQGAMPESGVNWLKEGILHADFVTTVSPTYAQEIQTPAYGAGLDGEMRKLASEGRLEGILNGIDPALFDPMTDPFIPENYDQQTAEAGKLMCKRVLQQELGLPLRPDVPVFGMVSRLVEQKGLDLLLPMMERLASRPAQWVILGAGEPGYETVLRELNTRFPNVRSYIGFHLALAQKVYAGSDVFLMPSRYEPCGLGQMIAFRFGAVPLVRGTGGLADTVIDIRRDFTLGNGFVFEPYEPAAMLETVDAALMYWKDHETWTHLVRQGMNEDFSWERSAKIYKELYHRLVLQPATRR